MRNDYPHTFGGVIGEAHNVNLNFLSQQSILVNKEDFKLCLSDKVPEHYYIFGDDSFIWTGGSKLIDKDQRFNYRTDDSKFVYVKIEDDSYSIVSDHYSKIPLFYVKKGKTLFFATSLEYLIKLSNDSILDINFNGLLVYYHFGITNFEHGLIENCKVLSGGSHLIYKNNTVFLSKYFDITKFKSNWCNTNSITENALAIDDVLLHSTAKTVKYYKKIGIALSGGVDSGYLAQKLNETNCKFSAYTIGFEDGYNEFKRIDYLAEIMKFKTKKIVLSAKDIIDNYLKVSSHSSFPLGFNNSIMNFIYTEAANDGVDVLFDGDGADRLFLGMNKFMQLQKFIRFYENSKRIKLNYLIPSLLNLLNHPSGKKMQFYFKKLNHKLEFYGERILLDKISFDFKFEEALNDLMLPKELKALDKNIDKWLFFSLFSIYYTPSFFFHTPYELQLKHNIVSNPEFWSDEMVRLSLSIPTEQKLNNKTTKKVLRQAAKIKIDNGYWSLSKIGLQNSFEYIKTKNIGQDFINSHIELIKQTDEYLYLLENSTHGSMEPERLIPYYIWKKNIYESKI